MAFLAAHCSVTVTAHADGDDILVVFGAADAFAEEAVDNLLVGGVVPHAILLAVTGPLLVVACHRFVVRRSHHDAHLVGQNGVERIVGVEGVAPHCRPHIVGLQAL